MTPIRIQRKRSKGWRMPPNTVSCCRPVPWGNPFRVYHHDNAKAVRLFEESITPEFRAASKRSSAGAISRASARSISRAMWTCCSGLRMSRPPKTCP